MGICIEKDTMLRTVGDVIKSLQRFPPDMPIEVGFDGYATVYLDKPSKGEARLDDRGSVCICGEDPWA